MNMNLTPETRQTVFVTLNWNTTALARTMIDSIEVTTPEPHKWIIVDNGSRDPEFYDLCRYVRLAFRDRGAYGVFTDRRDSWGKPHLDVAILRLPTNAGCVLGHNLAFDLASVLTDGAYDLVMVDTDVEVFEPGWLTRVRAWATGQEQPIGVVGMEHAAGEVCAGAVFLDTNGNWYIHSGQTWRAVPEPAESVGLGFALLRWPVPTLRFDTGFKLYYKQDDDLCFQVRADLGYSVWAFPVANTHWGSGSLKANDYHVQDAAGWDAFDAIKRANQRYFAQKWAWALRGRRPNLLAEAAHLREMAQLMAEKRGAV